MNADPPHGIWRVIVAAAVGTMIEWYDFYIFGSLAPPCPTFRSTTRCSAPPDPASSRRFRSVIR